VVAAVFGSAANIAAPVTIPLAVGLGFAINICISLTLGSMLITFLWIYGMRYPGLVMGVFIGEAIPGFNDLPGWTLLAVRSVIRKAAEEKKGVASLAAGVASAILSPTSAATGLGKVAQGISTIKTANREMREPASTVERPQQRSPAALKSFDGIRPANDNLPHSYAQAA
jgi:hypothetical protein